MKWETVHNFLYLHSAFRKIKGKIILIAVVTIAMSLVALIPPYLTKMLFNQGIMSKDIEKIIYYGVLIIFFYLFSSVLQFIFQALFTIATNKFSLNIRGEAVKRLLNIPIAFFDQHQSGYLVNRLNEVDSLSGLFSPVIFQFFSSIIQFVGALVIMINISKNVTLMLLPFLPVFYFVTRAMSKKLKKTSRVLMESSAVTRGNLQEAVAGIENVKQFTSEERKAEELVKQFTMVANNRVRQSISMGFGSQSLGFITSVASVAVMILAGIYITKGQLSVGDYMALAGYAGKLFVPMHLFGSFSLTIQPVLVALSRLGLIFDEKVEQELWGEKKAEKLRGDIEFKNVYFKYKTSKDYVLTSCNFSISSGDCVAIVGGNGAGKSTLVKLMLGFYPNYKGAITIDGTELHKYAMNSLREKIGIVSQNILLFTGSLKSNIKIANSKATDKEIKEVLLISGSKVLFNDVDPDNIKISEFGKNLSGGQKQAVAIARCLLKKPDILIFDEATAHLDEKTRDVVLDAFKNVFKDKTRILITHEQRISKIANRILLLKDGKIKEM